MSKIKVLHTADIHIGIENYGYINPDTGMNTRMEDFLKAFDIIINYAIENDFDLVIFAGDAFKVQSPTATHQREFAKRVYKLAEAKIPTILLAGNHDLSNRYGEATSMDVYGALKLNNVYVIERPQFLNIETKNGLVQILAIPYVSKSAMLTNEEYKMKTSDEVDRILVDKISILIDSYIAKANHDLPFILTFHAGVDVAKLGAETSLVVGKTFSVPLSVIARKEFDYVALGHIHLHQVLTQYPPVVYSGSIERVDFGEEGQQKGFMTIELEKNNTSYEFIKLPAREFITFDIDIDNDKDPTEEIIQTIQKRDIKDAIIRIRYTIDTSLSNLIDDKKIRDYLKECFYYTIKPIILDKTERVRDPELNESIGLDPIQALEKYISLNSNLIEKKEELIDRAKQIIEEEIEV
ncbi:MAG: exonuclease SbcCD subunit D [Candidatus Sericytochromatia bacterium]